MGELIARMEKFKPDLNKLYQAAAFEKRGQLFDRILKEPNSASAPTIGEVLAKEGPEKKYKLSNLEKLIATEHVHDHGHDEAHQHSIYPSAAAIRIRPADPYVPTPYRPTPSPVSSPHRTPTSHLATSGSFTSFPPLPQSTTPSSNFAFPSVPTALPSRELPPPPTAPVFSSPPSPSPMEEDKYVTTPVDMRHMPALRTPMPPADATPSAKPTTLPEPAPAPPSTPTTYSAPSSSSTPVGPSFAQPWPKFQEYSLPPRTTVPTAASAFPVAGTVAAAKETTPGPAPVPKAETPARRAPPTKAAAVPLTKDGLRPLVLYMGMFEDFMERAAANTDVGTETCGVIAGTERNGMLIASHLIIPKQVGAPDSVQTTHEDEIFAYQEKHDLLTFGWVHTHPQHDLFMSSVDLHTHFSYQSMMKEAVAVVIAPLRSPNFGVFRLTDPRGMKEIGSCNSRGFHPHYEREGLYKAFSFFLSSAYLEGLRSYHVEI